MYHSHLLGQTMTEGRQRETELQLARVVARWRRAFHRAERVGVEPTRA